MTQTTIFHQSTQSRLLLPNVRSEQERQWTSACRDFMISIPDELQCKVECCLKNKNSGGPGLRSWVAAIAWRGAKLPEEVPAELLQVYFDDPEAVPLHECESCGIAIPVRPNRLHGLDDEPEQVYFESCPTCGGRTGLYLFVSRQLECKSSTTTLRRSKPR